MNNLPSANGEVTSKSGAAEPPAVPPRNWALPEKGGGWKAEAERTRRRPGVLAVRPDRIPDELKAVPHGICWCYDPQKQNDAKGKWLKVPRLPLTGNNAKVDDPSTWA